MTGCSAPNCVNSYRKGFRLHSFPRNSERRKRWAINMRRRNKNGGAWVPPTHARLCDAHFEECQFETGRKDGWKKLKLTAIPTLFDVPNPPKKFATQRRVLTRNTDIPEISPLLATPKTTDHSYVRPNEKKQLSTSKENQSREDECTDNADTRSIAEPDPCSSITVSNGKDLEIRRWRRKNKLLEKRMEMLQKNLASIFNADQVEALGLQQGCTSVKWSPETIRSSVEMRAMVGADGYEYLRKRNFPLPSYRTLCTRLKHVGEAKPGLQHIIVDWNGEDIELVIPEEHAAAIALEDDMQLMDAVQLDSTV